MPSFRWRRLDLPGVDRATLTTTDSGYLLLGHARFQDHDIAVDLHYSVQTSPAWVTQRAHIQGMGPAGPLNLDILVNRSYWVLNGAEFPAVSGSVDVDLNFTPSTNLLSIRRLALNLGETGEVTAAWLEYPALRLAPLLQRYTRLPDGRYAYSCPTLPFDAILEVNPDGFVTLYPPLWEPE